MIRMNFGKNRMVNFMSDVILINKNEMTKTTRLARKNVSIPYGFKVIAETDNGNYICANRKGNIVEWDTPHNKKRKSWDSFSDWIGSM